MLKEERGIKKFEQPRTGEDGKAEQEAQQQHQEIPG